MTANVILTQNHGASSHIPHPSKLSRLISQVSNIPSIYFTGSTESMYHFLTNIIQIEQKLIWRTEF